MQVVLGAALVATSGLAWWVGRSRGAALAITLGEVRAFPNPALDLNVRVPVGWKARIRADRDNTVLELAEPQRSRELRRIVVIEVQPATKGATPESMVAAESDQRPMTGKPLHLNMLGTGGVLVEYPYEEGESNTGEKQIFPASVVACAVVQSPRPATVWVEMIGARVMAPADIDAVKLIARSLAVADRKHPAPAVEAQSDPLSATSRPVLRFRLDAPSDNPDDP